MREDPESAANAACKGRHQQALSVPRLLVRALSGGPPIRPLSGTVTTLSSEWIPSWGATLSSGADTWCSPKQ